MICYEESVIPYNDLPSKWQQPDILNSLELFLEDNWKLRSVLFSDRRTDSTQQFLTFSRYSFRTNQYIGTIVYKGERLDIFPKVFRRDGKVPRVEDMYSNIIGWTQYCDKSYPFVNIDTSYTDENILIELLISLYIRYVEYIISRNMYYQYEDKTEDLHLIRGRFDISDYLKCKIPNAKKHIFMCSYSEFQCDNSINRIIKCVLKKLFNKTTNIRNKKLIRVIIERLNGVADVVCHPSDCDKIHISKDKTVYSIIMNLSKMFLLGKSVTPLSDDNAAFCFLFPADMLFEGFIGGVIKTELEQDEGYKVTLQKSDSYLINHLFYNGNDIGQLFKTKHDIYIEKNGKALILDTKYKVISHFSGNENKMREVLGKEISQADVYQICEYARKRGVRDVCLIYPLLKYEKSEDLFPYGISNSKDGNSVNVHFLRMPFVSLEKSFDNVVREIADIISRFYKQIG